VTLLMPSAPERFSTARLTFRRPTPADAPEMWARYASDPDVTRHLAWPCHQTVEPTRAFVDFAVETWKRDGIGPWLVFDGSSGALLGSTGLDLRVGHGAMTGYLLVKSAWGKGLATEVLTAMVDQARAAKLLWVRACVHPDNAASIRVLEKVGFASIEGEPTAMFPNLDAQKPLPLLHYQRRLP
jgi:ribosomal-protein-alanine N-acetyltransferase